MVETLDSRVKEVQHRHSLGSAEVAPAAPEGVSKRSSEFIQQSLLELHAETLEQVRSACAGCTARRGTSETVTAVATRTQQPDFRRPMVQSVWPHAYPTLLVNRAAQPSGTDGGLCRKGPAMKLLHEQFMTWPTICQKAMVAGGSSSISD